MIAPFLRLRAQVIDAQLVLRGEGFPDTARRLHEAFERFAETAVEIADAAVLSLHPEGLDGETASKGSYTPGEVIDMTRRVADATRHMLTHAIGWPQHESNGWTLDPCGGHLPDSPCWIRAMNVPPHREHGWTVDRELQRFARWLAALGYAIERLPSASIKPIFRLVPARVTPSAVHPERAPEAPIDDPRQIAEKWARERFERSFILDADWHNLPTATRERLVDLMAAFVTEAIAAAAPEPPYEP